MQNLSSLAKVYILGTILIGCALLVWMATNLDLANLGLYMLASLGAVAQTLKLEGPDDRTNYSIAWFVYGFSFVALGPVSALFVVMISHLVEWAWHRYPWYIQSFNIGAHGIPVFLAGLVFETLNRGSRILDLNFALAVSTASLIFVFGNHFLVGLVVKIARRQSFVESGVFEFFTLFLDFTVLAMGAVTAVVWQFNRFTSLLNILPLYLLYNALRVPALQRQLQVLESIGAQGSFHTSGD